jgi:hypothetical protein
VLALSCLSPLRRRIRDDSDPFEVRAAEVVFERVEAAGGHPRCPEKLEKRVRSIRAIDDHSTRLEL